jgi:hypothetical protein
MSDDCPTMTDLLSRTEPSFPRSDSRSSPPIWLTGAAAGLVAAAAGVLTCLGVATLAWLSASGGSLSDALRTGASAWLLAHGSGLRIGNGAVTVVPLGLTIAAGTAAWFAGGWVVRVTGAAGPRDVAVVGGTVGLSYAVSVAVTGVATGGPIASGSVLRAASIALLMGTTIATVAAMRACAMHAALLDRFPAAVRPVLRGAGAGLCALVGCGAAVLALSLVMHIGALHRMLQSLHIGVVDGLLLVLVCVVLLPNVVLFAVAVLVGPGFAIGAGTHVSVTTVDLNAVPAVPWFAALPGSGDQPLLVTGLAALPLLCGAVAGAVAVRAVPVDGYRGACLRGGPAGATAGGAVGLLLAVSGGSIGPGLMAEVGPHVVACLVVAVLAMAAGGLLGGAAARLATRG